MIWTGEPCKNFHLLIAAAIFETQEAMILEMKFGVGALISVSHFKELGFVKSSAIN